MNQPSCQHPDTLEMEHHFVLKSQDLRDVLDWVYQHDNDREFTSYLYGHFHNSNQKAKESFRGFRLYIGNLELALLFKITFSDRIHNDCERKMYSFEETGTRF